MEFEWSFDNGSEEDMEDLFDEDGLEDSFDDDADDLFEMMDEKINSFPKTTAGMVSFFELIKGYDYINGWQRLWDDFSECMDLPFRMLVALHITTRFPGQNSLFPDLRPWLSCIGTEDLYHKSDKNTVFTLRDMISRDLQNGSMAKHIQTEDDWAILRIATAVDEHLRGLVHQDSNLVTVCWSKATPVGRNVQITPCVDFVRKDTLLELFDEIPKFESTVIHDLAQMSYYDVVALALEKTPVEPICLGPHTLLTTLLSAQVPRCVAGNKYGSVVKYFLQGYLRQALKEMRSSEQPVAPPQFDDDRELSEREMETLIREVYVFNKLSFYQEVSQIYRELTEKA